MSLNTRHVKRTRKDCTCKWCRDRIVKGEPSVTEAWISEGDFHHARYHPECNEAIYRWSKKHNWDAELPYYAMERGGILPKGEEEP